MMTSAPAAAPSAPNTSRTDLFGAGSAGPMHSIQNAGIQQAGALRSHHELKVHTHVAQSLMYGRKEEEGRPRIIGFTGYSAMLRPLWLGAAGDDPYADWWLVNIETRLTDGRVIMDGIEQQLDTKLKSVPGMTFGIGESVEPISFPIQLHNPYSFLGLYLLGQLDQLARKILTARHVALLTRQESSTLMDQACHVVRRAFHSAGGYRYLSLTREDVRQNNAKALRAQEMFAVSLRDMGNLPQTVLDSSLRAAHAPVIRRRDEPPHRGDPEDRLEFLGNRGEEQSQDD